MPKFSLASTPKYRRHQETGQAIVTIAGRDRYLGPYGSKASRIEYDRLVSAWIAEGRPATITAASDLTIVELCARYLRHAEQHYAGGKNGEIPAMRAIIKRLRKWYGPTLAIEFGPRSLKVLRQRMIDEGLSRNTINQNCFRIRRIFRWAVSEELVAESVCRALECVDSLQRGKSGARETEPVLPVSEAVVDATLPHLPPIVADIVRLQRLTGARPGEIVILRPCDVDTTGKVWTFRPHSHKTQHRGLERVIFIGPRGQDVLRPYLLRDKASYCFCPAAINIAIHTGIPAGRLRLGRRRHVDTHVAQTQRQPDRVAARCHARVWELKSAIFCGRNPCSSIFGRLSAPLAIPLIALLRPILITLSVALLAFNDSAAVILKGVVTLWRLSSQGRPTGHETKGQNVNARHKRSSDDRKFGPVEHELTAPYRTFNAAASTHDEDRVTSSVLAATP